jgi:hypothetical protein
MKRKRFTEEQIIAVLREHEAGAKAGEWPARHRGADFWERPAAPATTCGGDRGVSPSR